MSISLLTKGQPEALDSEEEFLTGESEEDMDSEEIEKDFDHWPE